MADEKKPSDQTQSSFKVDHDASGLVEMPSVTRLLNRKKLGLGTPSSASAPPPPPPALSPPDAPPTEATQDGPVLEPIAVVTPGAPSAGPSEIQLEFASSEPEPVIQPGPTPEGARPPASPPSQPGSGPLEIALSDGPSRVEIQSSSGPALSLEPAEAATENSPSIADRPTAPSVTAGVRPQVINRRAAPRPTAAKTPLAAWAKATLLAGTDPLGKGLLELVQSGAESAIFLAAHSAGEQVAFTATAALNAGSRHTAWAGIRLNPAHFPELWASLLKDGVAEFPPPGQGTDIGSLRNLARGAFATRAEEWITFFRAGTPASCRGILVVFSKASLRDRAASAMRLIGTPVVLKKAA